MGFDDAFVAAPLMLTGGSMYERMRRRPDIEYDPYVAHAALMYDEVAAPLLAEVHREYIDVARRARLPMLVTAGTWRANRDRIARSAFPDRPINRDHVAFVRDICDREAGDGQCELWLGGVLGPSGDAYKAEEGLEEEVAARFHSFQTEALAEAGVDVLLAMTLPALPEARGLARAMAATGLPYLISFVVRDSGTLLDGTPLCQALDLIDEETERAPLGYFVNCVHPLVLEKALDANPARTAERVVALKANTSTLRPEDLADREDLVTQPPDVLAEHMRTVQRRFGLKIIGGCCGTGTEHIEAMANRCGGTNE